MKMRAAVIGAGQVGAIHAEAYHSHRSTELAAVCSRNREKAEALASIYSVPAFTNVQEMLHAIQLDVCSVTTSGEENGGAHYEPVMALLEANVPVLCEKPLSNRLHEAQHMVDCAFARQIPLAVNFNHRFTPAAARAQQWIKDGRLGSILMLNMRLWIHNPEDSSPYYHLRALHPHSIDCLSFFGGAIRKVAVFLKQGEGRSSWSNLQAILQFENGAVGQLTGSYDAGEHYGLGKVEVVGSLGKLAIENVFERLSYEPQNGGEEEIYKYPGGIRSFKDTFTQRIHHWIDELREGRPFNQIEGSGKEGLIAQKVIEAMIESFETKQIIELPQLLSQEV